jgi:perosamine synthetase
MKGNLVTKSIKPFFLDISEAEIESLQDEFGNILRRGELILGRHTDAFENEFAAYVGTKYAATVNTGTSALEILLTLKGAAGKKIAVPSNTNFASVAAIIRTGGTPVFMDMTKEYFVPSFDMFRDVAERHGIGGVMWVHIGGIIPPDFCSVVEYCKEKGLFLIEDAAHAHGSGLGGVKAGNFADGGAFSFFPTKVMTTMEGGMITTNNESDWKLVKSFRNQGKRDGNFGGLHYDMGSSLRISEIAAYMGRIQLGKLDQMVAVRARAAARIADCLTSIGIGWCDTSQMDQASQYKFIIRLPDGINAAAAKSELSQRGVICGGGVYDVPCHLQPVFNGVDATGTFLGNSEIWCPRHICPPITSGSTDEDADLICSALREVLVAKHAPV